VRACGETCRRPERAVRLHAGQAAKAAAGAAKPAAKRKAADGGAAAAKKPRASEPRAAAKPRPKKEARARPSPTLAAVR